MTKNLLVVANLEHSSPRIPGLVTGLVDLGWKTFVLTPPLAPTDQAKLGFPKNFLKEVTILPAPYRGDIFSFWRRVFYRAGFNEKESLVEQINEASRRTWISKLAKWAFHTYQYVLAFPDTERTWIKPAIDSASEGLEGLKIDCILSSSPFPTSHIVANRLARKWKIPWVADFRDPWTSNHNYPFGEPRHSLERKYERHIIGQASELTAAAPSYGSVLKGIHEKDPTVIFNGFDASRWDTAERFVPSGKVRIVYTGTIYADKQEPAFFLKAVREAIDRGVIPASDIAIEFYGRKSSVLREATERYGLNEVVTHFGHVERSQSQKVQESANALLLFNWEDANSTVYPSKLFEYFGARRPILATGGHKGDDVNKILDRTRSGWFASQTEEMIKAIEFLYENRTSDPWQRMSPDLDAMASYSYQSGQKRLVDILNKSLESRTLVRRDEHT